MPVINGTTAFCFFPYTRNPKPIAPNIIPQISSDVPSILKITDFYSNTEAQGGTCLHADPVEHHVSHLPKTLCETRQFLEVFFYQTVKQEIPLVEHLHELNLEYF